MCSRLSPVLFSAFFFPVLGDEDESKASFGPSASRSSTAPPCRALSVLHFSVNFSPKSVHPYAVSRPRVTSVVSVLAGPQMVNSSLFSDFVFNASSIKPNPPPSVKTSLAGLPINVRGLHGPLLLGPRRGGLGGGPGRDCGARNTGSLFIGNILKTKVIHRRRLKKKKKYTTVITTTCYMFWLSAIFDNFPVWRISYLHFQHPPSRTQKIHFVSLSWT